MTPIVISNHKLQIIIYILIIVFLCSAFLYLIQNHRFYKTKTHLLEGLDTVPTTSVPTTVPTQNPMSKCIDPSGASASAALSLSSGPVTVAQNQIIDTIDSKLIKIQNMIDTINSQLPKDIYDISINSVALIPWENRDKSNITITNMPYDDIDPYNNARSIKRAKWMMKFILPMGPKGDQGKQGPPGDRGVDGEMGPVGAKGGRGQWGKADVYDE